MELEEAVGLFADAARYKRRHETADLGRCHGRITASDITAPIDVPHFPKSAMDGYAVRACDTAGAGDEPVRLTVSGKVFAGEDIIIPEGAAGAVGTEGTAVRIMTGARVPDGYDAVVRQEDTDYNEQVVTIKRSVVPYTNYCRVGEDIVKGSLVIKEGTRLGREDIGVLASLGIPEADVLAPLKVSIISTGCELVDPADSSGMLPGGKIYNSIAYMLKASVEAAGFTADAEICPDDANIITDAIINAARRSDIIITTGGVSVGERDLLPEVVGSLGAETIFYKVNIQPGTPTMGSIYNGIPILSLSGNPYAALVNYDWYFWPLVCRMTGCGDLLLKTVDAVSASDYPKKNHMRRFLRARYENGMVTIPQTHASSVLSNLTGCNCYIDLPEGTSIAEGDTVKIIMMPYDNARNR